MHLLMKSISVQSSDLSRTPWVKIPALSLTSCVTLDKLLNLSVPWFHL